MTVAPAYAVAKITQADWQLRELMLGMEKDDYAMPRGLTHPTCCLRQTSRRSWCSTGSFRRAIVSVRITRCKQYWAVAASGLSIWFVSADLLTPKIPEEPVQEGLLQPPPFRTCVPRFNLRLKTFLGGT